MLGGSRPPDPLGGRAGDGNNNAGAAFGGAPAALRTSGVVVPVPGPSRPCPPGGSGGREPPRKASPPNLCSLRRWWPRNYWPALR